METWSWRKMSMCRCFFLGCLIWCRYWYWCWCLLWYYVDIDIDIWKWCVSLMMLILLFHVDVVEYIHLYWLIGGYGKETIRRRKKKKFELFCFLFFPNKTQKVSVRKNKNYSMNIYSILYSMMIEMMMTTMMRMIVRSWSVLTLCVWVTDKKKQGLDADVDEIYHYILSYLYLYIQYNISFICRYLHWKSCLKTLCIFILYSL